MRFYLEQPTNFKYTHIHDSHNGAEIVAYCKDRETAHKICDLLNIDHTISGIREKLMKLATTMDNMREGVYNDYHTAHAVLGNA